MISEVILMDKRCTKCKLIKPKEEFAIIKARRTRKARCKLCISEDNMKWVRNKKLEAAKIERREQHIKELYCCYE